MLNGTLLRYVTIQISNFQNPTFEDNYTFTYNLTLTLTNGTTKILPLTVPWYFQPCPITTYSAALTTYQQYTFLNVSVVAPVALPSYQTMWVYLTVSNKSLVFDHNKTTHCFLGSEDVRWIEGIYFETEAYL